MVKIINEVKKTYEDIRYESFFAFKRNDGSYGLGIKRTHNYYDVIDMPGITGDGVESSALKDRECIQVKDIEFRATIC